MCFETEIKGLFVDILTLTPTHYASMKTTLFVYSISKNIISMIRGLKNLWMILG
jgi:hypothetical protein